MELTGTYTWRDSLRAFYLAARPRFAWGVVGVLLVLLAGVMLFWSWTKYLTSSKGASSPFGLTLAILFLLLWFGVYYPWIHYRTYRRRKLFSAPVTLTFTEEELRLSSTYWKLNYPWHLLVAARENRHLYLIYDAAGPLVAVPKRFAETSEAQQQLRAILHSRTLIG